MPIWMWDVERQRIIWANQACLEFSGVPNIDDLSRLRFSSDAAFVRQLSKLAKAKLAPAGVRELIRFPTNSGEIIFDCQCQNAQIEPGRIGILVELVAHEKRDVSIEEHLPDHGLPDNLENHMGNKSETQPPKPAETLVVDQQMEIEETANVQILSFDTGRQINGFEVEPEKVDEEDLLTLREIARLINGPIVSVAGGSAMGLGHPVSQHAGTKNEGRPLVATRIQDNGDKQQAQEARITGKEARVSGQETGRLIKLHDQKSGATSAENSVPKLNQRNYFLESLPVALAIAMGGRLMRANEAFLYAFGFGSESELRKSGGLAALFPESQNGVLVAKQTGLDHQSSNRKSSRSARVKTLGVSRSGRRHQVFVAFRNVSTGREPVQILILNEDALWPKEDGGHEHIAREERAFEQSHRDEVSLGAESHRTQDETIDFLANVSHEIRTPLNSIIGFSELMKDERFGIVDGDKFRSYAADIHSSAMHALSLINDLLDSAKTMSGKSDLTFTKVELNDMIEAALRPMQVLAQRANINLKSSSKGVVPPIFADQRSIRQILLNLISNAIQFTPEGGEIIVSARTGPQGAVLLTVSDTGIGMRQDQVDKAMEPFIQLENANQMPHVHDRQKGTGLGLSIVRSLVKAHHASMIIKSIEGRGTSVEICFPADQLAD